MDAELKAKWLKALRSGEYKHGRGQLRDNDDRFCCLGILVDTMDGQDSWVSNGDTWESARGEEIFLDERRLSDANLRWDYQLDLAQMNDGNGNYLGKPQTLAQIADWVEGNL